MLILWPPDANSQPIEKYSDAGKDWSQEEKSAAPILSGYRKDPFQIQSS